MKTLIIHPADFSTDFLKKSYEGCNYRVIDYNVSVKQMKHLIKTHDRIIMMGHGYEHGLYGYGRVIINHNLVYLLRGKICIYVWCYANMFCRQYDLKGIYTDMVISEMEEAIFYCVPASAADIIVSNTLFASSLKEMFIAHESIGTEAVSLMKGKYKKNGKNHVIDFNADKIYVDV